MTRYAEDNMGRPLCPICAAYGLWTVTRHPEHGEPMTRTDTGDTEPLVGIACADCQRMADMISVVHIPCRACSVEEARYGEPHSEGPDDSAISLCGTCYYERASTIRSAAISEKANERWQWEQQL